MLSLINDNECNYEKATLHCYVSHRSPEVLALVGRVDLGLEGGRRDRVVQRLDDLVVDRTGLAESVLRFEFNAGCEGQAS